MFALKDILLTGVTMLVLDALYLNLFASFFGQQIASVQRVALQPRYLGAILCYIFLILGLNFFIIKNRRPIIEAFILGIVIYGVYETTNYAIFKNWKMEMVLLDTMWGGILFSLTTFLVYKLQKIF